MALVLKELREKRTAVYKRMKEMTDKIHAEGRDFTAEEKPHWEAANKEYDGFTAKIETFERMAELEAQQHRDGQGPRGEGTRGEDLRPIPGREDSDGRRRSDDDPDGLALTPEELGLEVRTVRPEVENLAIQGWMLRKSGKPTERRHEKACRIMGISLRSRVLELQLRRKPMTVREMRALSATDISAGASLIAPTFSNRLETALLAFGGMRQVAEVIRTDTGAEFAWPSANDTTNMGSIVGENKTQTETDVATGGLNLSAYKYTSNMVQVPVELLEDSAFDLVAWLSDALGVRIARRQNLDFTVGTGAAQATGLITSAPVGVTSSFTNAFTGDDVVTLIHSVDPAYREDPSFALMMNDQVLLFLRKLKDGQGRYLFAPATDGQPATIWGHRYSINQQMTPNLTNSASVIVAGALSKYKIRDVRAIRFRRLVERYADQDQEGFVAFMRSDGGLLNAGVAPAKVLQLHA